MAREMALDPPTWLLVPTSCGRGVLAEAVVDRLYRSVRALRIYEGATDIQHLIIAGHRLRARQEGS